MISFFISACSFLITPTVSNLSENAHKSTTIVISGMFWIGLIFGIAMTVVTNVNMRHMRYKAYETGKLKRRSLPGALMFSNNIIHILLYVVIIVGISVLISDLVLRWLPNDAVLPILAVTYFVFVIHSIIDGKNYMAYKIIKEGKRDDYKKKNKDI